MGSRTWGFGITKISQTREASKGAFVIEVKLCDGRLMLTGGYRIE